MAERARFAPADWTEGVAGRFDLLVSNPPYIAAAEVAALAPDVRDWEPRHALTPGPTGLEAYARIVAGLPRVLAPGGRVLLEIGATQGAAVAALLAGGRLRAGRGASRPRRQGPRGGSGVSLPLSACHSGGGAYMVLLIPPERSNSSK